MKELKRLEAAHPAIIGRIECVMSSTFLGSEYAGRVIDGRFTLLRWLGGTEWSSVFLTELGDEAKRKAAIKLVLADRVDAQACIAQWEAAKTLSHAHLMGLFHHGRSELDGKDLLYAVTEYAEEVLAEILPVRPLTPAETCAMLRPVLDALSFLHGRDRVHGHLKPSNIMVVDERLKLSADRLEVAGELVRRPPSPGGWDAPETGTEKISAAADVWLLGVVVVEALTQQPPAWDRGQGGEPEVPASLPQPFLDIARECLRVDPARRSTLSGVKAHLEPAQAGEAMGKSTGKPLSKAGVMAVAGALLGVCLTLAILRTSSRHAATSPVALPQPSSSAPPAPQRQSAAAAGETHKGTVVKGEIVFRALPDIPEKIAGGIQGHIRVGIRVQVDPDGNVVQTSIDSPGPSRYFANQALKAAQKWKFTAAWVGGHTVASVWMLHFQFGATQTDVNAEEDSP